VTSCGNLTQHNVQKNQGGSFPGLENLFFPREVEVSFFGQIDPYARAEVRFEAEQDSRGGGLSVSLAEANLTLMALPYGTQLKMGKMRNRFGYLNQIHAHDWPFIDNPNVLQQFFGTEGLVESGFEATWVPPVALLPRGAGRSVQRRERRGLRPQQISNPLVTVRVRTFLDFDEWGAIQIGSSIASGQTPQQKSSNILGFDAKYKYTPAGLAARRLHPARRISPSFRDLVVTNPEGIDQTRQRDSQGFYVYAGLQPFNHGELSKWMLGLSLRSDAVSGRVGHGVGGAAFPLVLSLGVPRFRLGYKQTTRSQCCSYLDFQDNGGSAKQVSEYFLQATFIMGAHPAHPF
jgi:hypothetical protein